MGKRQNKKGGKNSKPNTPQMEKAGKQTPTPKSEQLAKEESLSDEMASFYEALEALLKGDTKPNTPQMEKAGKQTPTPKSEQFLKEESLSDEMASFYEALENTKVEEKIPKLVPAKENGQKNKQNDKAKQSPNAVTPAKASPGKQTPRKADKKTPGKQPAEKLTPGKKTPVKETPVKAVLDIKSPGKTAPPGKQTPGKAGAPGKMEAGQKKTPAATSAIKDEQQKQKRDDSSDVDEEVTISMPTSSLDKDVTKEVACTEVTPKDVPDGEWQLVRKRKGKKQITSSSSESKFLLSADKECSWILGMVIDFVHLLQILLDFRNEHPRVPNARPTIKLQNIRLAICFGTGSPRPTHFRYAQLEKFDTMADSKNSAFHSSYEAEEFNELVRLCKKPSIASFLDVFGLQLRDVEDVVSQLQQLRDELMNDFHFV